MDIRFTALKFSAPRNITFKYRLDGLDREWIDAGRERVAHFSHLAPGEYRFRVKACNNDGIWNEVGDALMITVLAPFWKTPWFITAASLATLGWVAAIARYFGIRRMRNRLQQLESEHAVERKRSRIAKDMHDTLGASLSEIILLSEMAQGTGAIPAQVHTDLKRIARRSRDLTRSLAEIVWAVNPQHDAFDSFVTYTCNFVEDYLRLTGIRCRLEIPQDLPTIPLSAPVRHNLFLLVKEAVYNIVKHAAASQVRIQIRLKADGFQLSVEDDGKGFDLKPSATPAAPIRTASGHGLSNMRERAKNIGGKLQIQSQPGHGTRIHLEMGFAKNDAGRSANRPEN